MKFSKITAALALAGAAAVSLPAAAATITNLDGNLAPFGGFDWASGGAAWTTGLSTAEANFASGCIATCNFSIDYAAWAVALTSPGGGSLAAPKLDSAADGPTAGKYEYTIKATLTGTIVGQAFGQYAYVINAGSFNIYYDTNANANIAGGVWTGFDDGVVIISGTLSNPFSTFFNPTGVNSIGLTGIVTSQDNNYVNPQLLGSELASTLQLFGAAQTSFTPPTSVDGFSLPPYGPNESEALFQADANHNFTFARVPEPGSLLLAGLALASIGAVSRRRRQV